MNRQRAFLILQAALCAALALWLAAGAVRIYAAGSARRAEDPLEDIYTAENVAQELGRAAPLAFMTLGALIAGIALGVRAPDADRPAGEAVPAPRGRAPKHTALIRTVLAAAAAAFIALGILNGSARDVLAKAIHICTECVGLG